VVLLFFELWVKVSNRKWELSPIKLYTYNLKDKSKKLSFIKYMDRVFDNCENKKNTNPQISDMKAGKKNVWELFEYPKKENIHNPSMKKDIAEKNHEFIKEILIFCTFRSVHFEFRNTLPSLSKVDLNLELRSNSKRK